ncbi:unnamed protein product [Danaus chrysippus]|uniref:(African queen) hypothetical protein n=1 Tax=Danaus chrysippus TaxID=151541 RepID=A0A8J2QC32_9NEOP|nr:unnamed protein product [Danaus chrysippus]
MHTGEKPLKCSECNKTFRRHSTLCQHMKKHRGIRNHVCNICSKAFYEVSKLNAHMRVHTGERPFECQFCSRKFAQQSALIYHKRTHTGEKPYACKACPARFTTSSSRNNHMLTHTGNKKFVCPVCFKGCTSRSELRVHSTKHTGEKLFACEICSQRFSSPSYLAVHRRTHTGEKKYQCTECGKGFVECTSYKKHMKTHAKDKPQSEETKTQNNQEEVAKIQETNLETVDENKKDDKEVTTEAEINQDGQIVIQDAGAQKRFKCGLCVKSYTYLHSLKKHMLSHVQMCVFSPDGSERMYAFKQQQQQQELQQQQQQQQQVQQVVVGGVGGVQQLAVPVHQHVQPLVPQNNQQYPVISSVQLQQTHQQVNTQPQLQVQTIQIHPQHQPIQIHAVGVQQEQLHVATSSCQTMVPNILQLQPGAVVSGLGQELGGVHRIILQPPHAHPHALYTIHH